MLENLFDWEQPDNKTNNYIMEYGKAAYAKEKRKTFWFSYLSLVVLEYFPLGITLGIICTHDFIDEYCQKTLVVSITSCILIVVFSVTYYILRVHSKKKILLDISENKVKTLNTVVRDKKKCLGKHIISVQLLEDKKAEYRVAKKLYKNTEKGSAIVAIKYENKKGFNDIYDFILNPNTITEDK